MRLDKQPLAQRWPRKSAKHAAWLAIAFWTGFTFVGYVTPIRELWSELLSLSTGPWETFWIAFYGFATYGNAGWMREQVCKYMCPYARFQSAMFDKDTLVITYDAKRGEPRGKRGNKGDCVDCGICVQACPTGIDIRNGLQYECIGCAACVDGCDQVMDKVGRPRGLIRYATTNAIEKRFSGKEILARIARPRVMIYAGILAAVALATGVSLFLRVPLKVDVIRDRAAIAREVEGNLVENVYRLQIMNTTERARAFEITVTGLPTLHVAGEGTAGIGAAQSRVVPVRVRISQNQAVPGTHPIEFQISAIGADDIAVREKSVFIVR
jgi:cytochrome c oxidase accessory protein FixG